MASRLVAVPCSQLATRQQDSLQVMWYCWHGARILDKLRLVVYPNLFIGGLYIQTVVVWDFWTINSIVLPWNLPNFSKMGGVLRMLYLVTWQWGNGHTFWGHTCLRQAIVNKHVQDPVWSPAEEPLSQGDRMNLDQSFICSFLFRWSSGWWFQKKNHHYLGKIPILTNIFQRGWNHQLVIHLCSMLCIRMFTWLCLFVILEQKIITMCSLLHDDSPFFPNQCETHVHVAWIIDSPQLRCWWNSIGNQTWPSCLFTIHAKEIQLVLMISSIKEYQQIFVALDFPQNKQ